jgi:hypothetical protein
VAPVVRDIAHDAIASLGPARLKLDVDGTVLRVCGAAKGAARGFNAHHPKDPLLLPVDGAPRADGPSAARVEPPGQRA